MACVCVALRDRCSAAVAGSTRWSVRAGPSPGLGGGAPAEARRGRHRPGGRRGGGRRDEGEDLHGWYGRRGAGGGGGLVWGQ